MSNEHTNDAAGPSPASAGSHGDTLVRALRILARDIYCEDGIATQCIREAADEIERFRITDEEWGAMQWAADTLCVGWSDLKPDDRDRSRKAADTLRMMLGRLG